MAESWQARGVDPITMELLRNALQTLVDEMAYTLGRTCVSQLVRDVQDFSTGLCDSSGNLIALSITQPGTLAMIPGVLAHVIPEYGSTAQPGDVIIVNDPYHGGTHLNDIHLMTPVVVDGAVVAWVTSKAHHVDVGGKVPGSMSFDCSEIFQEGLRIPPLKLYEAGRPNASVFKMIELNVRYPDVVLADLGAQIASLEIGQAGVLDLVRQYGADALARYFA
ncbi:MAG TPA: hydantoinase B/oxoprolinase family protein, partial [Candidatus Dormibacteraeota bacterium]|nr:hydantoinase B/oxoprolinase family protein [Candidatus Dormibacteraeota bacterium]